jgi:hypothetical protein
VLYLILGAGQLVDSKGATNTQDSEPVEAVAVLEHPPETPIDWNDMTVTRSVMSRIRAIPSQIKKSQRSFDPYQVPELAPSARLTPAERERLSGIRADLAQHDIAAQRWELEVLARGAKVKFGDISMQYEPVNDWAGF